MGEQDHDEEYERLRRQSQLPFGIGAKRPEASFIQGIRFQGRREILSGLVALIGLGLAATGILMVCSTPTFSVYQQGNHVLVNGQSLISQGNGGFLGDGALVIKPAVAGNQIAGASFQVDGEIGTGRCELRSLNAVLYENCQFSVGDRQFSSQDTFDLGQSTNWTRLYSDGVRVNISVPSNAQVIPVPFPVGESG